MNVSICESVKWAFFKIMGFAGKRFLFSPPLPSPLLPFLAVAPIFELPKGKKCLERAEKPTETLATQAIKKKKKDESIVL